MKEDESGHESTVNTQAPRPLIPLWVVDDLGLPTGDGIRIGVIDSGWDRTQPNRQVRQGISFVNPDDDLALTQNSDDHDRIGHGTACADLILTIAPKAEIYPIRVFGTRLESSVAIITESIRWAMNQNLHLVNMSLGTLRSDALRPLYLACASARAQGILIVAAKHNSNAWSYPSIFDDVIGVDFGNFASPFDFTYRSGEAAECVARGRNQQLLWLGGRRIVRSGTSFAAPNISGIIALLLERYPAAALNDIRNLLARYSLSGRTGSP